MSRPSLLRLRAAVSQRRRAAAVEPHHGAIGVHQACAKIQIRARRTERLGRGRSARRDIARLERRFVLDSSAAMPLTWAAAIEVPVVNRTCSPARARKSRRPGRRPRYNGRDWRRGTVVVPVGRGHRDDIGIGGRISGGDCGRHCRRPRSAPCPCRRPPPACAAKRIGGAGEAHIDDARAVIRRPLQAFVDGKRVTRALRRACRRMHHRQNLRARRDAGELAVLGMAPAIDGTVRDAAFRCRPARRNFSRCCRRDPDVLHRFPDRSRQPTHFCPCDLLRLRALQFRQNVLRRIAMRTGGNLGGLFLQRENVFGSTWRRCVRRPARGLYWPPYGRRPGASDTGSCRSTENFAFPVASIRTAARPD